MFILFLNLLIFKLQQQQQQKVDKYENEQKTLLEELTLAHAKLVEVKLTIDQIEQEKVCANKTTIICIFCCLIYI